MNIKYRFGFIIVFCVLIGLVSVSLLSYQMERSQAQEEVHHTAVLILETATAIRSYTAKEVKPIIKAGGHEDFISQMVPSYSALSTLAILQKSMPEYLYREAALNPTNTNDRANAWEVSVIQEFRRDPELKELVGEIDGFKKKTYVARPIRVKSEGCLECHSVPERAPPSMVAKYGTNNGFGWKLNEVVGAQIVEVPNYMADQKAMNSFLITIGALTAMVVLGFSTFLILYRVYVATPLQNITERAEAISLDNSGSVSDKPAVGGQFSKLEGAIHRLQTSIDYAADLIDKKVDPKG